ncbi:MAG: type IV toxin-antitoxin system AbiEi family antitoxin [Bacteriovoracia bacterium]
MGTSNHIKLNQLLATWPNGAVFTASWLKERGVYYELLRKYRSGGWVRKIGNGAVARAGDEVHWTGGLYAIQTQLELDVHVGSKTALELQGFAHFVPMGKGYKVFIFGRQGQFLPTWFLKYKWDVRLQFLRTNLFSKKQKLGLVRKDIGAYSISISSPERAIFEFLYLVKNEGSFEEAHQLMQGLATLRSDLAQELLRASNSIKVNRLFMYLAEKSSHAWVKELDLSKVDFGKGKRVIVPGGKFDSKYKISVPEITS